MSKDCNLRKGEVICTVLIPETPFEDWMSLSTWNEKRAENARKILYNLQENVDNGIAIIIKNEENEQN